MATTEGNNRPPSALGMMVGSPAIITAHTELVVPRSIPMILLIAYYSLVIPTCVSLFFANGLSDRRLRHPH